MCDLTVSHAGVSRRLRGACAALILALGCAATPVLADDAPSWRELSSEQRKAFARMRGDWDQMPAARRNQLIGNYQRWKGLSADEKDRVREKRERYKELTPEQRQRLKDRYERERD